MADKPWQEEVGKAIDEAAEKVNEGFILGLEMIEATLLNAIDQINEVKQDLGTGNIRLRDAIKKRDMILQEIGKSKSKTMDIATFVFELTIWIHEQDKIALEMAKGREQPEQGLYYARAKAFEDILKQMQILLEKPKSPESGGN